MKTSLTKLSCTYHHLALQLTTANIGDRNTDSSLHVAQDPNFTAKSTLNKAIGIPQCAISTSKTFRADKLNNAPQNKRRKRENSIELASTIAVSDSEDLDDLTFLLSDEEDGGKGKGREDLVVL